MTKLALRGPELTKLTLQRPEMTTGAAAGGVEVQP